MTAAVSQARRPDESLTVRHVTMSVQVPKLIPEWFIPSSCSFYCMNNGHYLALYSVLKKYTHDSLQVTTIYIKTKDYGRPYHQGVPAT